MPESHFLIIHEADDGTQPVFVTPAHFLMAARLKAMLANHPGTYIQGGPLTPAQARKVPRKLIGRTLTRAETSELQQRLTGKPSRG